jgi:hypothetical protein
MTSEFALRATPNGKALLELHINAWLAARSWTRKGTAGARLPIGEWE